MSLWPGPAMKARRILRPASSVLSALTPEKVPTPPDAAQAPELSPFEMAMPLPPSTSGRTSRPEMTMGLRSITSPRDPAPTSYIERAPPAELAATLSTAIRDSVSPPFRPPRYILSHEHVPYCDLTIEIAEVGWAGEFR